MESDKNIARTANVAQCWSLLSGYNQCHIFFKNVIFDLILDKFVKFVENSQNCQIWQKLYNLLKF